MCTYNRAHFIQQAVDSVLSQTFQDWELLILDDCSTDNTVEVISPYLTDPRIKHIKNETNLGITKNRNKALTLATGEYVAVLDSDDYWIDNNKLALQNEFLDLNKEYVLIGSNNMIIDNQGKRIIKVPHLPYHFLIKKTLLFRNAFCHSSVLYRKNEIVALGGYDESLPIWEDYDLWLKVGLKYKFANFYRFTTAYRRHDTQSNADKIKISKDTQAIIIEKYKKLYFGYSIAKMLNALRNIIRP
ncbi:glycosyltransferase [Candidatus Parcubacteria bacterium]|nr:glycosyltransferase [Candidatus Parcubacteria bacterium]